MGKRPIYKRWWVWGIFIILIIIIATSGNDGDITEDKNGAGNNTAVPNNNLTDGTPTPTATPSSTLKAGMYKVGTDIPSGEYVIFSENSTLSYYQVTKDSTGSLESIISNDNFSGTRYITVDDGQYIEIRDSSMIAVDKAPILGPTDDQYTAGMYKVGRDIKAGEYKLIPTAGGGSYVEVAQDSRGILDSILSNDNFTAEKYVTIGEGQYIKLVGCYLVSK